MDLSLLDSLLSGFEEVLEDDGCGNLVDDAAMVLPLMAGLIEDLVGFAGGEPLVPEMDGQFGEFAEFGGKGLCFGGLRTRFAGQVQGIADHNACDRISTREPGERAEIFARIAAARERHDGLRGQPQLVRYGNADAPVADVECEVAGVGMRGQRKLLAIRLIA
jgi:hypothetical protein